ncbi:MAG TPA: NADH-ubiquinone oxidoreductase-F iron-sulfur binding region domain-containing protein [Albitalea sp.]|nr:NADH-ubiquinone oxidoreductase-F iron-sulfur binding region domain-containing protein [Albitalea sp.]
MSDDKTTPSPARVVTIHADGAARRRARSQAKGRQPQAQALDEVRRLLAGQPLDRDLLIEHLHRLNDAHGHLPDALLVALAHEMRLSLAEVYEVASFYHHFEIVKDGGAAPAALTVRVCNSLTCAMAGSDTLKAALVERLLARSDVRVVEVPCIGRCDSAPAAVVGQHCVDRADAARVLQALADGRVQAELPAAIGYRTYVESGGYRLLDALRDGTRRADDVIAALSQAGLRGLGGAGFAAGRKWSIVAQQPAPRLVAVNIDEGEPGTFKDRFFLERDPHRFIEGALVAAHCVGAAAIYLYLRDEYAAARALLERELATLRAERPGLTPIHLRRGAGAYICGEESALIESLEGKRGWPRLRPPYVAQVGLFGRPTLEHNMETLHWVRDIVEQGPASFAQPGRRGRQGVRAFSLSGRVKRPGVHLAPAGISVQELIDEYGGGMLPGHTLYGYFPGGASGGMLPASLADLPLDFDTLQPHGCFIGSAAVIVFSQHDSARALALNAMRFFEHESCGQCTPCREGTQRAVELMSRPHWDQPLLQELGAVMMDASICGLGQAAPNPLLCAMKYFPQEFDDEPRG